MADRPVSWIRRAAAAAAAVAAAFTAAPPFAATPVPRNEEWWFSTWDITNKVWPISTGRGVTVAVLDTGVNARLRDLAGVVLPGTDLTGKKDDGRIDHDTDKGGHGTAMAAMIAGQGPEMVGVAPDVKLLPVAVLARSIDEEAIEEETKGIRYAVAHGAQVISMSNVIVDTDGALRCDPRIQGAVDDAIRHDVVLVAAAGNDRLTSNDPDMPAACPGVLAVGAVDSQANPWAKTERQPYVAVAAPGVNTGSIGRAGIFGNNNGTSAATALTAGVVALVRAKFPKMSGREVVQRIIASALDTGPRRVDQQTGYGLLRPYHALVDHVPANAPNPVYVRWDQEQRRQTTSPSPSTAAVPPSATGQQHRSAGPPYALIAGIGLGALVVLGGAVLFMARRRGAHTGIE